MTKSKIPKLKSRKSHKDTSSSNEDSVSLNEPETEVVEQVSNEAFSEEPDSGETVDSSDIDIDLICRSTIDNVKHMWENQKLKAFSSISKTLMDTSSIQSNLKVVTSESTKQFGSSLLGKFFTLLVKYFSERN